MSGPQNKTEVDKTETDYPLCENRMLEFLVLLSDPIQQALHRTAATMPVSPPRASPPGQPFPTFRALTPISNLSFSEPLGSQDASAT